MSWLNAGIDSPALRTKAYFHLNHLEKKLINLGTGTNKFHEYKITLDKSFHFQKFEPVEQSEHKKSKIKRLINFNQLLFIY